MSVAKITVHTIKCTGAHRNFLSATNNYLNAVFCVYENTFRIKETEKMGPS